ncbi:hypothetical protein AB0F15_30770 [Amycolatopsis sp. NPDC026612]|uniref:hypothetical protein n=1 Tax=Amycolatopsis sp. NPDC026612 TaxID=3155466 RepID=UPI0033F424FC
MNSVESFVNVGGPIQPLELVTDAAPVSCFWAAFNGAGAAYLANLAIQKGVDWYQAHHGGGHFATDGFAFEGASEMSAADLLALRGGH